MSVSQKNREPGYYWVKITCDSTWSPQLFNGSSWEVSDYDRFLYDHCIHEIDERRITRDEQKS